MRTTILFRRSVAITAATAALISPLSATAQAPPPEYEIKFDRPRTGSLIRLHAVRTTGLPINLTYQQLSPEQRAAVHSWYENIAPRDEPPFPAEGTKPIHDAIRQGQAKLLVTGELFLIATVEPTGEVSAVTAIGSPSPEMTKFAATILMLTQFKPAVCAGQPCRMDFPLRYEFRVD